MSDNNHIDGRSQENDFEREDLAPRPILLFLLSLAAGCVLVYFVLRGMYSYLDSYENHHQPVQNPLVQPAKADTRVVLPGEVVQFPQPRLETDERREINDFREREEQTLNSYGWLDQSAGVVHIPIDRAMQLVAQRGLPTRPQTGTVPSSDVNTANQAAHPSDMSPAAVKRK
jgi:hypothetical protein